MDGSKLAGKVPSFTVLNNKLIKGNCNENKPAETENFGQCLKMLFGGVYIQLGIHTYNQKKLNTSPNNCFNITHKSVFYIIKGGNYTGYNKKDK